MRRYTIIIVRHIEDVLKGPSVYACRVSLYFLRLGTAVIDTYWFVRRIHFGDVKSLAAKQSGGSNRMYICPFPCLVYLNSWFCVLSMKVKCRNSFDLPLRERWSCLRHGGVHCRDIGKESFWLKVYEYFRGSTGPYTSCDFRRVFSHCTAFGFQKDVDFNVVRYKGIRLMAMLKVLLVCLSSLKTVLAWFEELRPWFS